MAVIPAHVADGQIINPTTYGNPVLDALTEHESEINDATTGNAALGTRVTAVESGKVPTTRTVSTSNGLQGGGDLSANRTLSPVYGTAVNTVAQGNDSRIVNAVQTSRSVLSGTGLTGGGDLSADRTLAVAFGSTSTTVASGDRVTNLEGPSCIALLTGTVAATGSSNVTVTWDSTEQNDSVSGNAMWASGTPTVITVRKSGLYTVSCQVIWDPLGGAVSGQRIVYITKNQSAPQSTGTGTLAYNTALASGTAPGGGITVNCVANRRLAAGDVIRVITWTDQASTNFRGNSWGGNMTFIVSYKGP
jgi:hypothetical protein